MKNQSRESIDLEAINPSSGLTRSRRSQLRSTRASAIVGLGEGSSTSATSLHWEPASERASELVSTHWAGSGARARALSIQLNINLSLTSALREAGEEQISGDVGYELAKLVQSGLSCIPKTLLSRRVKRRWTVKETSNFKAI